MATLAPEIGDWFLDGQKQLFEVVAIDDHAATIEIQYVDGEVSEIDMESWRRLPLEAAAPPEDWAAPYEMENDMAPDEPVASALYDPLNLVESEMFEGYEDF